MTLRFIHISDTHVGPTPDFRLWDLKPFAMLESLIVHINTLPFQPDFVLHTGDMTQNASDEAYYLVFSALKRLKVPLYCLPGNHDNPAALSQAWMGSWLGTERLDYSKDFGDIRLLAYDTCAEIPTGECLPSGAGGIFTSPQLEDLRRQCASGDQRLLIAMHHQPVKLDSTWLDEGFDDKGTWETMILAQADEFLGAIAPARNRIVGVFFGHVHRGFQVVRNGILFSSAPSATLQFRSYPGQTSPIRAHDEPPGFNLVSIEDDQTIVRQYTFPRV